MSHAVSSLSRASALSHSGTDIPAPLPYAFFLVLYILSLSLVSCPLGKINVGAEILVLVCPLPIPLQ